MILSPGFTPQEHLGPAYEPFKITGDPNAPNFEVPNIGLQDAAATQRLAGRMSLRSRFDSLRASIDHSGMMEAVDQYQAKGTPSAD